MADIAHGYAEVGVGLLVVNLPNPYDPADLEPLADALRPLRRLTNHLGWSEVEGPVVAVAAEAEAARSTAPPCPAG